MAEFPPPHGQDFDDANFPLHLPYFDPAGLMQVHEQNVEAPHLLQPHGQNVEAPHLLQPHHQNVEAPHLLQPHDQNVEVPHLLQPHDPFFNPDLLQVHQQDFNAVAFLQPPVPWFNPVDFHPLEQEIVNPELFQPHGQYIALIQPHEQGFQAAELNQPYEHFDPADQLQPHEQDFEVAQIPYPYGHDLEAAQLDQPYEYNFQGLPLPEHVYDYFASQQRAYEWVVKHNDIFPEVTPKEETTQSVIDSFGISREPLRYYFDFNVKDRSEGQFNDPSAIAVNSEDILVADTENNRILSFTGAGVYRYEIAKQDNDEYSLISPNSIAVEPTCGEIIVSRKYPCSAFNFYNRSGRFLRQFRLKDIKPRCITIDSEKHIIVVSSKTTKVTILDYFGMIVHQFEYPYLKYPKNVVVNERQEIFITDNLSHCVYVFNYSGRCLRKIGGKGIVNFPIGVLINRNGEVIIADNYHAFNVTIFNQDGTFVKAYKNKVHKRCIGIALLFDQVTLLCKDSHIYLYKRTY